METATIAAVLQPFLVAGVTEMVHSILLERMVAGGVRQSRTEARLGFAHCPPPIKASIDTAILRELAFLFVALGIDLFDYFKLAINKMENQNNERTYLLEKYKAYLENLNQIGNQHSQTRAFHVSIISALLVFLAFLGSKKWIRPDNKFPRANCRTITYALLPSPPISFTSICIHVGGS